MVSWIRMYADSSGPVGGIGAYNRIQPPLGGPVVGAFNPTTGAILATPGTVDANVATRMQYLVGTQSFPKVTGAAGLRFTAADVAANPGKHLTGTLFVAPAANFPPNLIPTPAQIIAEATEVTRGQGFLGTPSSLTAAGDLTSLVMIPAVPQAYPPNTKFWALIAPTAVVDMSYPANKDNDLPVGDVNTNGRAMSLWTNRTPLAPIITSPKARTVTTPGTVLEFSYTARDPDRINAFPTDASPPDFEDMAGIQVQYARAPSESAPNPVWQDLPITDTIGTKFGPGWYIDGTPLIDDSDDGARDFWGVRKIRIRCGTTEPVGASTAFLPSGGEWQIRIRTFDYGHAFPNAYKIAPRPVVYPLNDDSRSYTPDTYPAVNTSPWSAPVFISISEQVPAPIPVRPINNLAVVEGSSPVVSWRYRNTYSPPYAQLGRTVQIREIGGAGWVTLIDQQASALDYYEIDNYPLVSGNQYEWRVQVRDASGVLSEFSEPATFWVVPAPATGDVIPASDTTIEGATLGCGTHRVAIFRRGGLIPVGEITDISEVEWKRLRDDISTARITVKGWGVDCGNLLASLTPWAHEVVIFRNNGTDVDRVWEGPITLLTYKTDEVVIQAKDVMVYAYRRIIKQAMVDTGASDTSGTTVVDRAARTLQAAFAPDDPNVLAYMQRLDQPDDARQYRSIPAYSRTAFEEVDDMASNSGLDYTAVGRAILLWGTKHRIGTLPEFRDEDLGSPPIVSVYGMSYANRYAVSDGTGVYGEATRLNDMGQDPETGLVEMLSSTWASDETQDTGTYTQAGVESLRRTYRQAAERSISDRNPVPVVVRVPDNTTLNPSAVISIQSLVPGVVVPLRSTGTLRSVVATQKLDSVTVKESGGTEVITIVLSPFSRDDAALGEGTEE